MIEHILLLAHNPFCNNTASGVAAQSAMLEPYADNWELMIEGGTTPIKEDWTIRMLDGIIDPEGNFQKISKIDCEKYVGCYWALVKVFKY